MYITVEEGLLLAKVMFASQGFSVHLAPHGWEAEWTNTVD